MKGGSGLGTRLQVSRIACYPHKNSENKSSMEHIPRVHPRNCMLLESCLYVLSMNMFVLSLYLHAYGIHDQ